MKSSYCNIVYRMNYKNRNNKFTYLLFEHFMCIVLSIIRTDISIFVYNWVWNYKTMFLFFLLSHMDLSGFCFDR